MKENIMENCVFLNKLKLHFSASFSMLEKVIEICPNELWNKKVSGFIFWKQALHTIRWGIFWLRGENIEFAERFDEKNGYPAKMKKDPEKILLKDDVKECCFELKEMVEKWFSNKDDNWLKLPCWGNNKITNFDVIINQIKHFDYHIGYCESIFREHNINPGEYIEYLG
jgi:hypothetical protein